MVQKSNKNIRLIRKFKRKIQQKINVDKLILFGSRAKGSSHKNSDFDIMVISKDFRKIKWYKRPVKLYTMWKENYPIDILCYTPEEFRKRTNKIGIVSEALQTGIEV